MQMITAVQRFVSLDGWCAGVHEDAGRFQDWGGMATSLGGTTAHLAALGGLAALIAAARWGATQEEGLAYSFSLSKQGDGEPRQLPYAPVNHLVEHLDRYLINV